MNSFLYGIIFIFLGGFISLFSADRLKAPITAFFTGVGSLFLIFVSVTILFSPQSISSTFYFSSIFGEIRCVIDHLSAFFIFVISLMSFMGTIYAVGYMKPYIKQNRPIGPHFFFLSILVVSMLCVVVVQNALGFLIVWEIMSLSSFFLVTFENEKKEVFDAGINYIIAMHIGVIFLIAGFIILSLKSGSLDFNSFRDVLSSNKILTNGLFIIFFIGFGMKAGFFPMHTWLPKAHPAAPSHISGIMSGVMIKTGIYGILRILTLTNNFSGWIAYFVLFISIISAVLGVMYAISQHDLKKLLAYHSVENIGIIGIGIGIGMLGVHYNNIAMAVLGFSGGILHILNHSIFKELLFYGAGSVYEKTHTRDIEKLGGLIKSMPFTAVLFLIGSLAISGLPPFNGFISEFIIYGGMLNGFKTADPLIFIVSIFSVAMLSLVGVMALLCFTKVFSIVFLGNARSKYEEQPTEADGTMIFPMGVLAALSIAIGIFPQYAVQLIKRPVMNIMSFDEVVYDPAPYLNTLGAVSRGCFLFIGMSMLIYAIRCLLLRNRTVSTFKTWDCGYQAGNTRMQYTASSYAGTFLSLAKPILKTEAHVEYPEGIFPKSAKFESHTRDMVEKYIIGPCVKSLKIFLDFFSWIQSGSTQQYILYGLIFLILALLWAVGVK